MRDRFAVIGAGTWGTALSIHLGGEGHDVRLWGHDPERTRQLARRRENVAYLPGFVLPDCVSIHEHPADALEGAATAVLTIPSHAVRAVLEECASGFPPGASAST